MKRFGGATRRAAVVKLALIRSRLEALDLGLVDRRQYQAAEASRRPLAEVLQEFRGHLEGKRRAPAYIARVLSDVTAIAASCAPGGAASLAEIDTPGVELYLTGLLDRGVSYARRNDVLAALGTLFSWALRRSLASVDPTRPIVRLNRDEDPRRPSRALNPEEFEAVVAAAAGSPRGATGSSTEPSPGVLRGLYYLLAGRCGLRWGEIRQLTWPDVDLGDGSSGGGGWLNLRAAGTKSRRADVLPLSPRLVQALAKVRPNNAEGPIFRGSPTLLTWRHDLVVAGVVRPYCDLATRRVVWAGWRTEHGQVDRKNLRATFITHLALRGVDLTTAVVLARHTDPRLTRKHYLKAHLLDLQGAVAKLDELKPNRDGQDARDSQRKAS